MAEALDVRIMKEVIRKKKIWRHNLRSYRAHANSRLIIRIDSTIALVSETVKVTSNKQYSNFITLFWFPPNIRMESTIELGIPGLPGFLSATKGTTFQQAIAPIKDSDFIVKLGTNH